MAGTDLAAKSREKDVEIKVLDLSDNMLKVE